MALICLPSSFVLDHWDRMVEYDGIVLVEEVRMTNRHVWIRADDPGIPELIADARHYTAKVEGRNMIESPGIVAGARAVLKALGAS